VRVHHPPGSGHYPAARATARSAATMTAPTRPAPLHPTRSLPRLPTDAAGLSLGPPRPGIRRTAHASAVSSRTRKPSPIAGPATSITRGAPTVWARRLLSVSRRINPYGNDQPRGGSERCQPMRLAVHGDAGTGPGRVLGLARKPQSRQSRQYRRATGRRPVPRPCDCSGASHPGYEDV
jgi:hypothetical protein